MAFWSFKPSLICFAFFLFFACNRTNQTIGSGNKHARRSKHTSVLNVQWYGNSEIILFYFRHTAGRCFGSISFSASSDVVPTLQTRAQAAPLTSWNMHESDRDTASAPGWNREILPAAVRTGWTQNLSYCLETQWPAHHCVLLLGLRFHRPASSDLFPLTKQDRTAQPVFTC